MQNMTKRMRGSPNGYLRVLQQPFTAPATHIPDQIVQESGLVTSRSNTVFTPFAINNASSTHNGGLLFLPYPAYAMLSLYELTGGSGNLSDLTLNGSAYNGAANVPNLASLFSSATNAGARVRLVSMGVRVTYEGTELNRSGRYYAGLCPITSSAVAGGTTPFPLSSLSTICGQTTSLVGTLRNCMTEITTARVSDGTFEFHWVPVNVPSYQQLDLFGLSAVTQGPSAGATLSPSLFNAPVGGWGAESGQNALVFWVEGDTTSSAQINGNNYAMEVIWHWELIPTNPQAVAYALTPSVCNLSALQAALNAVRRGALGKFARTGDIVPESGQPRETPARRPKAKGKPKPASTQTKSLWPADNPQATAWALEGAKKAAALLAGIQAAAAAKKAITGGGPVPRLLRGL